MTVSVPLPPGYVVVTRLGQGGFATVWLAEQGRLGRRVAVKVLAESLDDAERERRFLAECQAIGRLSGHPAVVTVHDAGTTDQGHPYLVMEHLPGGSLHDRLHRSGPLPWPEVLDVGVHVADALAAAHDAGILHRDVKPANVLLDENGDPKLGDFGIARLAEGTHTATGTIVGTIPYTPPEVLSGHRPGPTADVWSLGATLHALLTGSSPFAGDGEEPPAATVARVLRSEPPTLPPSVPAPLRELLGEMLMADPAGRPQSAVDVVARLQQIQTARGLPVTLARSMRGAATPPPASDPGATVVGLSAVSGSTPPPTPSAPVIGPPPTPTPAPLPADAPTTSDPRPGAPATVAQPAAAWSAPAPPPPGPTGPAGRSRSKAPLLVALAVLVVLAVAGGLFVVLGGGDDDPEAGTSSSTSLVERSGEPPATDEPRDPSIIDTIWGATAVVPTGVTEAPGQAWSRAAPCAGTLLCSVASLGTDVVLAYGDGAGGVTLERAAGDEGNVDGEGRWRVRVETEPVNLAVAAAGPLIVLATTEGDQRVYRTFDPDTGAEGWSRTYPNADRSIRPAYQSSGQVMVLMLTAVPGGEAVGLEYETGDEVWRLPGRVLTSDADAVYIAVGDEVGAYELGSGEERWRVPVDVDNDGSSPAGRLGVVLDDVLITTSNAQVLALGTEDGSEAWDERVSLSDDDLGVALGSPLVVAPAGGVAVVAAEQGDVGVDPRSGTLVWREQRDPLIVAGESHIWIGTASSLVTGRLGATLREISTEDGSMLREVPLGPAERSLSSNGFLDGVLIASDDGLTAYGLDGLPELWSDTSVPGTRAVTTIDGGVVVVTDEGFLALR